MAIRIEMSGPLSHVLLAVKARHIEAALALIRYLDSDGYVVSLQNGLEEAKIAALAGADSTISAFPTFVGHYRAPGDVGFDPKVFAFHAPGDPLAVQATWERQHRYWNRHEGRRTG